jgi:hypothetical protein
MHLQVLKYNSFLMIYILRELNNMYIYIWLELEIILKSEYWEV